VQGHRVLHGTFGQKKGKSYISERTLALCSKTRYRLQHITLGAENILTPPNDILSDRIILLL